VPGTYQIICCNSWVNALGESIKMARPLNSLPASVVLMLRSWTRYLVGITGPNRILVSGKVPLVECRLMLLVTPYPPPDTACH
jgi:hypothetical protein